MPERTRLRSRRARTSARGGSAAPASSAVVGARRRDALLRQADLARHERGDEAVRRRDRPQPDRPVGRLADLHGRRHDADLRPAPPGGSSIDGLVRRPLELSYAQLLALPKAEQVSTFHCVTGWIVEQRALGRRALPRPARRAPGRCRQAHARALRLGREALRRLPRRCDQVALPDVMLAYEMDGKPLPQEHGAPVRVVIPDMYGYKNVKWVERITLVAEAGRAATGSSAATTSTPGSGAPTAMAERDAVARPSALRRALHAHRAAPALGPRERVLRPARLRARSSTSRRCRPPSRDGR